MQGSASCSKICCTLVTSLSLAKNGKGFIEKALTYNSKQIHSVQFTAMNER